jgi:subtilisin-like proprotein convertase family protein
VTADADLAIPDKGPAVSSALTVTGCDRPAGRVATVAVRVLHPYRGDVVIDLVAPDGSAYRLKDSNLFDAADDVVASFAVDLSAESANGTWQLRLRDAYGSDAGHLDSWTPDPVSAQG